MRIAGLLLQWRYLAFLNPYDATIALDLLRRWEDCGAAGSGVGDVHCFLITRHATARHSHVAGVSFLLTHTHTHERARTSRLCVCADHIHGVLTLPQFRAGSLRFLKGSSQSLLGGGNATASAVPQLIQETLATHQLVRKTGAFKNC